MRTAKTGTVAATETGVAASERHRRIPALDGMRGLAVGLVLMIHLFGFSFLFLGVLAPTGFDAAWLKVARTGWMGVDLFFVLSGFLITGILYESKGPILAYFRNFYARRALRIFPAYYALLFVLLFLVAIVFAAESDTIAVIRQDQFWFWTYLSNIRRLFVSAQPAGTLYLTGHLWSLAIEEQFYLVWPVFVLMLQRKYLVGVSILAIVGALMLRFMLVNYSEATPSGLYTFTPARIDALAIGALIAMLVRDPAARQRLAAFAWPAAAISFCGIAVLFFARDGLSPADPWVAVLGLSVIAVFFGSFLTGVILSPPSGRFNRLLSQPVMTWLGKYSYAIYLIHFPLVNLMLRHTTFYNSFPEVFGSVVPRAIAFGVISTALSLALALLSWRLIETPFLKLRSRFPQASGTATW